MGFSRIGLFAKKEDGAFEAYHLVHSDDGYYRKPMHKNLETLFSNLNAFFPREYLTKIRIERTDREYDQAVFYQNIFNDENKWLFTTLFIESIEKKAVPLVNGMEDDLLIELTDYVIRENLIHRKTLDMEAMDAFVTATPFADINTRPKQEVFVPEAQDVASSEWFLTICSEEGYPILSQSYMNGTPSDLVPNIPQNLTPDQKREFYVMFISGLASSFLQFYNYGYYIRDFVLNDRILFFDRIKMDTRVETSVRKVNGETLVKERKVDVYFPVCLEFRNVHPDGRHFGVLGHERHALRSIVAAAYYILREINFTEIFNQNLREEQIIPLQQKVDEVVGSYFEKLD